MRSPRLRLFIDENVQESVRRFFEKHDHEVTMVRDVLFSAPDDVVAAAADVSRAIVVTWNTKDFEKLISRRPDGNQQRLRHAGLLGFICNEAHGVRRLEVAYPHLLLEAEMAESRTDKRVILFVEANAIRVSR